MKNIVFKPGSYNVATGGSQPGLDGMRFVMDTLVSKGLASTEDCCTYTLVGGGGGAGSVSTSFNSITDTLTITVDGVSSSVPIAITANSVLTSSPIAINGVTYPTGSSVESILSGLTETVTTLTGTKTVGNPIGTYTSEDGTAVVIRETISSVGTPTLSGSVLTIPFTNEAGVVVNSTVDLSTLATDINVGSVAYNSTTGDLTITETDGTVYTVNIPLNQEVDNGISVGTDNKIELGGVLHKDTQIDAIGFKNTVFGTTPSGDSWLMQGGRTSRPVEFTSINGGSLEKAEIYLDTSAQAISSSSDSITSFRTVNSVLTGVSKVVAKDLVTSKDYSWEVGIDSHRAENMVVLTQPNVLYIDPITFKVTQDIAPIGLPRFTQMFNSDALAAAGGIAINEAYWCDSAHVEGAVHGTLKLRTVHLN